MLDGKIETGRKDIFWNCVKLRQDDKEHPYVLKP